MSHIYITNVNLENHPYIHPVSIELPSDKSRSLIITGKNGCGKTTLLDQIALMLDGTIHSNQSHSQLSRSILIFQKRMTDLSVSEDDRLNAARDHTTLTNTLITKYGHATLKFNTDTYIAEMQSGRFILAAFKAKRETSLLEVKTVSAPKVDRVDLKTNSSKNFLQYLVNRKTQQAFALSDNEQDEADSISHWFEQLNFFFSTLFEQPVRFHFNRNNLHYTLIDNEQQTIDFNKLSDGYSSVIQVITEIIMRMEVNKFGDYGQPGIVCIDEIETHLHVSLQKQILPMLMTFFPNIQFIVTTHSPFILSSINNAVIYDMERDETITQEPKLWKYSYEALVEGYFEVEKFSDILKTKIIRYKDLNDKSDLEREERKELRQLKKELTNVPTYKNPAIENELKNLGLK